MRRSSLFAGAAWGALAAGGALGAPINSIFDPNDYASNGSLNLTSGQSIVIDTDALTVSGAATATGVTADSQSGNVRLALFNFDAVTLPAGSTVTVQGRRGLVLASKGNISVGTTVSVAGSTALNTGTAGVIGGSGAEGGVRGTSTNSVTATVRGNGGSGSTSTGGNGVGFGGGQGGPTAPSAGGGGGFAGAGGIAGNSDGDVPATASDFGAGGPLYGDDQLTDLFGGSGGGGGADGTSGNARGAGGGGGALELVALGSIDITGALVATGGNGGSGTARGGGGGSGGAILLAAQSISLSGTVNAAGGAGGTGSGSAQTDRSNVAGGGSGGRVAFYSDEVFASAPAGVTLTGGAAGGTAGTTSATNGAAGSFYDGPAVPEPGTLALAGVAAGALGLRRRARRRSSRPA